MISIQGLSYRYRRSQQLALDNINLTIPAASAFGLLGPNGAGKSTLLAILNGLLPIREGSVSVAGFDCVTQIEQIKAISSLIPQDYAFYTTLTGRENLNFFAGIYCLNSAARQRRFDYCVEVCQLQEILDRRVEEYSGGMKRRLNLALGLLNAPRILYLDEPTVGVDAISRQCIIEAIRQLKRDGVSVIYISHYMEEVQAICDEVAVINHGRVMLHDRLDNILTGRDDTRLSMQVGKPIAAQALIDLQRFEPTTTGNQALVVRLPQGADDISEVLEILRRNTIAIDRLNFGVSQLEEVYLAALKDTPL